MGAHTPFDSRSEFASSHLSFNAVISKVTQVDRDLVLILGH